MSLRPFVEDYKLQGRGHRFWPPYWINEPGVRRVPLAGKATPSQLKNRLSKVLDQYLDPLNSGEEVRYLMYRNGLGIDCSALAFYLLNQFLKHNYHTRLADHLIVDRKDILLALSKKSWRGVSKQEVEGWPPTVSLAQVCSRFQKSAIKNANVSRLCDLRSSVKVKSGHARPGDFVYLEGKYGQHMAVVIDVEGKKVVTADSRFDPVGLGGIIITHTTVDDLKVTNRHTAKYLCRLKVLNAAS